MELAAKAEVCDALMDDAVTYGCKWYWLKFVRISISGTCVE